MMIGKPHAWLSNAEYEEYNEITYDQIKSCNDLEKLRRLELYMRQEGFPQTADVARQTIIDKGGCDPRQTDPPITESEVNDLIKNIESWETSIKGKDEKLRELQMRTATREDGNLPAVRNSPCVQKDEVQSPEETLSKYAAYNGQHWKKWDENSLLSEKDVSGELTRMDKGEQKCGSESHLAKPGNNNSSKSSKTACEREWHSQHEREKGNDLYKAQEYNASIDAYSCAIELFPESPIAYCNRAAALLKMRRWDEAHKDCSKALEIDPIYVKALVRRGIASLNMENPKEALKDLEEALALDPTNREIMKLKQNAEDACERHRNFKGDLKRKINSKHKRHNPSANSKRIPIEEVNEIKNVNISQELLNCERLLTESGGNMQQGKILQKQEEVLIKQQYQDGPFPKLSVENHLENKKKKVLIQEIYRDERSQKFHSSKSPEANITTRNGNLSAKIKKTANVKTQQTVKMQELKVQQETGTGVNWIGTKLKSDVTEPIPYGNPPQLALTNKMVHDGENINQASIKRNFSESLSISEASITSNHEEPFGSSQIELANEWQTRGSDLLSKGEILEALKCYSQSLIYFPNNACVLSNRALCYLKQKNFEAAVEDSSRAISLNPACILSYHCRGLSQRMLKRLEEAKEDLQKVLEAQPGNKSVLDELESIEREREESTYKPRRVGPMVIEEIEHDCLSTNENMELGASVLRTAYSIDPSSVKVSPAGQSLDAEIAQSSRLFNESIDMLIQTRHQDCPLQMNNNSNLLPEELSTIDKAAVHCAEQLCVKGNMQFQKEKYVAAVNNYSRSIESNPLVAATYANQALCYIKLGSLREAEKDCAEAIRLDPHYTEAYYRRANILQQLGDLRGAVEDLKVALQCLPENQELQNKLKEIKVQLQQERSKEESCCLTVSDQLGQVHQSCGTTSPVNEKGNEIFIDPPVHEQANPNVLGQTTNVHVMQKISMELQKPLKIRAMPRTALDFERSCLDLQNDPDGLRQFMKSMDVKHFPNIFKESLGASTMEAIVESLQKGFMPDEPQGAFNILEGLSKVRRFKLAIMLMTRKQQLEFVSIFEWLMRLGKPTQESVLKLKEQYGF